MGIKLPREIIIQNCDCKKNYDSKIFILKKTFSQKIPLYLSDSNIKNLI